MEASTRQSFRTEALDRIDQRPALVTFVVLLIVYLATASWTLPYHIDPLTNVLTAWKLGADGSVVVGEQAELTGPEYHNVVNQLLETPRGPVSKYPPGASLLAAPWYSVFSETDIQEVTFVVETPDGPRAGVLEMPIPALWPSTLTAVLTTAAAMAVLAALIRPVVGDRWAWVGALLVGLGTSLWSVAADSLWQHGPTAMWLLLGIWGFSRSRYLAGSAAFGLAVITRPQTAIIVAVMGVWAAIREKSVKTLIEAGAPAAIGAALYIVFNRYLFGSAVEYDAGGYWVEGTVSRSAWNTVEPLVRAFFDGQRGVLVWSPFVVIGALAYFRLCKGLPWWLPAAATAGLVYLVIQVRGNGYAGGTGFLWYRYQLETLVAAAPLIVAGFAAAWEKSRIWQWSAAATGVASVTAHAVAAVG